MIFSPEPGPSPRARRLRRAAPAGRNADRVRAGPQAPARPVSGSVVHRSGVDVRRQMIRRAIRRPAAHVERGELVELAVDPEDGPRAESGPVLGASTAATIAVMVSRLNGP